MGNSSTITGPRFSGKNICQRCDRSRRCASCSSGSKTIANGSCSGKQKDTEYYVDLLKIDHLIEGYVSGDDADRSKPAPDIFIACVDKFKLARNESIVIGDTRFDVEAAARAGLRSIGVTCGGTDANILRAGGATAVYKDPADILAHYSNTAC